MMHAPFYNTNKVHALEAELMREAYRAGVEISI